MAPAWATTTSRFDGSVMIARSPVAPARIAASVPWPPSSSDGTSDDHQLAVEAVEVARASPSARTAREDRRDPALHVARAAAVQRAVADLAAPRIGRPGRGIAGRDDIEMARQDDPAAAGRVRPAR